MKTLKTLDEDLEKDKRKPGVIDPPSHIEFKVMFGLVGKHDLPVSSDAD
jgi:hypothetical protein